MDFLKKHYEKILLGVVLVGLAGALVYMMFKVGSEKQSIEALITSLTNPKVQALSNLDMTVSEATLKRMATPAMFDYSAPHRLFNPMAWQKKEDGHIIPQEKVGPSALQVTNITPLYLRISLDNVTLSDTNARYTIGVQKEAAVRSQDRGKKETYCAVNAKTDTFIVKAAQGKPDDLATVKLTLELNDTGEAAVIATNKPFARVDGYMADLRYPLENRPPWLARRIGATLTFNNEDYKIVAINQDEVTLSAPNQKKWTIKKTSSPASSP
jgi:flagellar basal body-associated protein FliL